MSQDPPSREEFAEEVAQELGVDLQRARGQQARLRRRRETAPRPPSRDDPGKE